MSADAKIGAIGLVAAWAGAIGLVAFLVLREVRDRRARRRSRDDVRRMQEARARQNSRPLGNVRVLHPPAEIVQFPSTPKDGAA